MASLAAKTFFLPLSTKFTNKDLQGLFDPLGIKFLPFQADPLQNTITRQKGTYIMNSYLFKGLRNMFIQIDYLQVEQ